MTLVIISIYPQITYVDSEMIFTKLLQTAVMRTQRNMSSMAIKKKKNCKEFRNITNKLCVDIFIKKKIC